MKKGSKIRKLLLQQKEAENDYIAEIVDAYDLGNSHYQIHSIPCSVEGFAVGDIVTGFYSSEFDYIIFVQLIRASGHKLLRADYNSLNCKGRHKKTLLQILREMGCKCKGTDQTSIDISNDTLLNKVKDFLEQNSISYYDASQADTSFTYAY